MANEELSDTAWDDLRSEFALDPTVTFLNHGSFGSCPRSVFEAQDALREEIERQPVEFLDRRLPRLLGDARERAAAFLGADPAGFVWVRNATTGVATVLASLELATGDEVLMTDHAYDAVRNAARRTCDRAGARLVVQHVPFPPPADEAVTELIAGAITPRTRLVIIDAITSATALVFPVGDIVRACRERGAAVLVDGAHAPGQFRVDVQALGADYWTGNFHKWAFAPRGTAALVIALGRRDAVHPLVTSHGMGRGLHAEFDWTGTDDPTAYLSVPTAIDFLERLGADRLRARNHALARFGRDVVATAVRTDQIVREEAFASMATIPVDGAAQSEEDVETLQAVLYETRRIEVPFFFWKGRVFLRLSAQVYNRRADYEALAAALPHVLAEWTERRATIARR